MRKLLFVLMSLLFVIAGCGRGGTGAAPGGSGPPPGSGQSPAGGAALARPEAVVENYLAAIGRSDYRTAASCLEHPKAVVWPGVGLLEATFNAKVPPDDVVRVSNIAAGPTFTVSPRGDEVGCLARAHVAPGKEAYRWHIGQEGDWQFAFYLIKRDEGWRLARGMSLPQELADYLEGNRNPFQNVVSQVPAVVERGKGYELAFDLHLPKALAAVEEVSIAFMPEPGTEKYPYSYETAFSTYWYGPGGQKMQVSHFELADRPGPDGVIWGPVTPDAAMPPGKYRFYLGLGTNPSLYWAVPPYVVTVK
ncbi:hypothetical protein [Desulfothermobacter acidiphilus]|uniref:hypothetical protein n=1 Tax=Desulfothermobacter acidiphilus TaxID=1938353 RepID=UPI003F8CC7CB